MEVRRDSSGWNAARRVRSGALLATLVSLMLFISACGGSASSGTSAPPADAQAAAGLKYGNCMRAHGVTNFPEANGAPQTGPPIDLSSPQFLAAEKACAKYGAGGLDTSQAVSPQTMQALLKYVACMRSHGVPDMPDPNSNGTLSLPRGSVSASSPQFQSAQKACQKLSPALGGVTAKGGTS